MNFQFKETIKHRHHNLFRNLFLAQFQFNDDKALRANKRKKNNKTTTHINLLKIYFCFLGTKKEINLLSIMVVKFVFHQWHNIY